jgi:hypothetical protein
MVWISPIKEIPGGVGWGWETLKESEMLSFQRHSAEGTLFSGSLASVMLYR